jgi:SAM-dependent methyltransferase
MGATATSTPAPRPGAAQAAAGAALRQLPFAAAIALSAFLLFSLQLRAGRLVLPVFGGVPAVWATALSFFTALLFVAYLYAHFAATRLAPRVSGIIQVVLAAVALAVMLLAPTDLGSLRNEGTPAALNVLFVLAVVAGAPAFLLGTTTPLLSSWYARRGSDPWWLFAVSNAASFAALLLYPFVLAPLVGLSAQKALLAAGLALYAAALIPIVRGGINAAPVPIGPSPARAPAARPGKRSKRRLRQGPPPPPPRALAAPPADTAATPIRVRRYLVWLVAALVPAGLLSATTNFLQTDLMAAPLIWIGPLGMYLASFVAAFSVRGRHIVRACIWLAPVAAAALWVPYIRSTGWPASALLVVELGVFFVFATAIHGRLADSRPHASQLTRFYLVVTAGGALGTAFVALVAPQVFSTIYEYPLLIVAGLAVLIVLPSNDVPLMKRDPIRESAMAMFRLAAFIAIAFLLYFMVDREGLGNLDELQNILLVSAIVPALAFDRRVLAPLAAVVLVGLIVTHQDDYLVRTRNFFGVVEVREQPGVHLLYHGTTLHGLQFGDDARRKEPTSYYVKAGPLGSVFEDLRARTETASIGAVGLGSGTVATYAQPGDNFRFFEIDRAVVDIALNPRYFTYLTEAAVPASIVLGDARLSLEREAPASFDLLILDAFSSDAVPAHLLTKEAMQTYARTLRPGGLMAFHLSNRYYDLVAPVANTARSAGFAAAGLDLAFITPEAAFYGANTSVWVVVGDPQAVQRMVGRGWHPLDGRGRALTDDYSDLMRWLDWGAW